MNKKKLYILTLVLSFLSLVGIILSAIIFENNTKNWWTFAISLFLTIVLIVLTCFVYCKHAEFICKKCNKQFKPKTLHSIIAIHLVTKRYLRCPHCNKKSWAKTTWKNEK